MKGILMACAAALALAVPCTQADALPRGASTLFHIVRHEVRSSQFDKQAVGKFCGRLLNILPEMDATTKNGKYHYNALDNRYSESQIITLCVFYMYVNDICVEHVGEGHPLYSASGNHILASPSDIRKIALDVFNVHLETADDMMPSQICTMDNGRKTGCGAKMHEGRILAGFGDPGSRPEIGLVQCKRLENGLVQVALKGTWEGEKFSSVVVLSDEAREGTDCAYHVVKVRQGCTPHGTASASMPAPAGISCFRSSRCADVPVRARWKTSPTVFFRHGGWNDPPCPGGCTMKDSEPGGGPRVIVFDFSHVYEEEAFCRGRRFTWLDCTGLRGSDCYCDDACAAALRRMIGPYPPRGIHFIDSGGHHYLTKLWTDKIREPWSLVLFDEHTDMQAGRFGMLSCGDWVGEVIRTNAFLRSVVVAGASDELIAQVPPDLAGRVHFFGEREIADGTGWREFCSTRIEEPVYVSIDKDVLSPESAATDWSQGSMTLDMLEEMLRSILRNDRVIGVDICGECPAALGMFEREAAEALDSHANAELLKLLLEEAGRNGPAS